MPERTRVDPAGRADDPQRGGPGVDEGVTLPATPPEPQPAADWREAFERYVEDLPELALDEIVSLYRTGGGGAGQGQNVAAGLSSADAPDFDRVAFITSRSDLAECLRRAGQGLKALCYAGNDDGYAGNDDGARRGCSAALWRQRWRRAIEEALRAVGIADDAARRRQGAQRSDAARIYLAIGAAQLYKRRSGPSEGTRPIRAPRADEIS